jgi:hypothetical protein
MSNDLPSSYTRLLFGHCGSCFSVRSVRYEVLSRRSAAMRRHQYICFAKYPFLSNFFRAGIWSSRADAYSAVFIIPRYVAVSSGDCQPPFPVMIVLSFDIDMTAYKNSLKIIFLLPQTLPHGSQI